MLFSFASPLQDRAVLQRGKVLHLWGYGENGRTVTVQLNRDQASAVVADGRWICHLPPQTVSHGIRLSATCDEKTIVCDDICIGDVFLAGGQSNMEFLMEYASHWDEAKELPGNPEIRMFNQPRLAFDGQIKNQPECGYWFDDRDPAWARFSAVGYWFARYLQPDLNVPVGIIGCNWGGTSASAWSPEKCLKTKGLQVYLDDYFLALRNCDPQKNREQSLKGWASMETAEHKAKVVRIMKGMSRKEQKQYMAATEDAPGIPMGPYNKNRLGGLYESMFLKVAPYSFKAVLWYQGENDDHHPNVYSCLFRKLTDQWRRDLMDKNLPFLCVQLAPFERWMSLDGSRFPLVRKQQELACKKNRNCFVTSSMDIGMRFDIHPKEKRELGRRLCLLAEEELYGRAVIGRPPRAIACYRAENRVEIQFDPNTGDLHAEGKIRHLFSVSQRGKNCRIKSVKTRKNTVALELDDTATDEPLRIDFAVKPYCRVKLYNNSGIPAVPFTLNCECQNNAVSNIR